MLKTVIHKKVIAYKKIILKRGLMTASIFMKLDVHPVPWSAPIVKRGMFFNPRDKEKREMQRLIRSAFKRSPIQGHVSIYFEFHFEPPKSLSAKKRKIYLENKEFRPTKCDATNLQKFQEDCIKNILITDDRNVVKISSEKLYAEKEGILIVIYKMEDLENL